MAQIKNPDYNDQQDQVGTNEQDGRTKLQSKRVWKKKDFMSRIGHSQSSKHLAFRSRHKHQNKHCIC